MVVGVDIFAVFAGDDNIDGNIATSLSPYPCGSGV